MEHEHKVPKDLDGWHWALSDSESNAENATSKMIDKPDNTMDLSHETELKEKGDGDASGKYRSRVAEQREE